METRLADLRIQAQAAALERSDRAGILAQTVANLEAEKALTMQAIEEIETARVQAMMRFVEAANAQTADRLANELEAEQEYLDAWAQAYEDNLARIDAQIQASAARRRAAQEADPSSPLNIFGPAIGVISNNGFKIKTLTCPLNRIIGASVRGERREFCFHCVTSKVNSRQSQGKT